MTAASSIRAIGSVPDVISLAFSAVKFTPLVAGSVAGNLPFGIVPEPRFDAFSAVSDAPEPLNDVAVATPVTITPELLTLSLVVPAVSSFIVLVSNFILVVASPL